MSLLKAQEPLKLLSRKKKMLAHYIGRWSLQAKCPFCDFKGESGGRGKRGRGRGGGKKKKGKRKIKKRRKGRNLNILPSLQITESTRWRKERRKRRRWGCLKL